MAKQDPAFLFYPKDWKSGTSEMTPQEKGVYVDLLCHQHQNGSLPCEIDRIRNIVGIDAQTFKKIWAVVSLKFYESEGRLYNAKLMEVMGERSAKAKINKIIGTFGAIIKKSGADFIMQQKIRKAFNPNEFVEIESERLTERLTEWYDKRLAFLVNGNGDADNSTTTVFNHNAEFGKQIVESTDRMLDITRTFRNNKIKSDHESIKSLLKVFIAEVSAKDDRKESISELQSHFVSWAKINAKGSSQSKSMVGL